MFPLQWVVLVWVPLAVSQPAPPNCCATKTVGGVDYTFVREDSAAISYSCLSPCVYERDDQPGTSFCFAQGDQQVVCGDSTEGCSNNNCQLTPSEKRMVDFGFGQVQRVVEGSCGLDAGQVLTTVQEEDGVFQFSISISPKNLSCNVNANEILPAICEIAVQATNTTDLQVVWERVNCDDMSLEKLASNLFEAMANLTHILPQMANISNLFLTAAEGQNFLQHFQDPVHVFEAVRNITTNLNIGENIVNIFQITQNVTTTLLEIANLTDIFSESGNGDNSMQNTISEISQIFPLQNMTTIIESIGIGAEFVLTEGMNFLQGEGNFSDIGTAVESVPNLVESALEDFNNIFPNIFG